MKKNKKICLISSTGGHYEQLLMLKRLNIYYDVKIITEKTNYNKNDKNINGFLIQLNRTEKTYIFKMLINFLKSFILFIKFRPDIVISTGVLSTIPFIIIAKIFKKKVIYIESFAKINSPTKTGSFIYKHNLYDKFYVQWESMLEFYPNANYVGGVY